MKEKQEGQERQDSSIKKTHRHKACRRCEEKLVILRRLIRIGKRAHTWGVLKACAKSAKKRASTLASLPLLPHPQPPSLRLSSSPVCCVVTHACAPAPWSCCTAGREGAPEVGARASVRQDLCTCSPWRTGTHVSQTGSQPMLFPDSYLWSHLYS